MSHNYTAHYSPTVGWTVYDHAGRRWWPTDAGKSEIMRAQDPEAKAVQLCIRAPKLGYWQCF